jgi:hypothetical protein
MDGLCSAISADRESVKGKIIISYENRNPLRKREGRG